MIAYIREQLLACRPAAAGLLILRRTRKCLFTFRLWRPRRARVRRQHVTTASEPLSHPRPTQQRMQQHRLTLATLNARSIRNKSAELCDVLSSYDLDVFALTEMWHEKDGDLAVRMLQPDGYRGFDATQSSSEVGLRKQRGGGVLLLHKDTIAAK